MQSIILSGVYPVGQVTSPLPNLSFIKAKPGVCSPQANFSPSVAVLFLAHVLQSKVWLGYNTTTNTIPVIEKIASHITGEALSQLFIEK